MKLNKQTIYTIRCLMYLAKHHNPQSAQIISDATGVRKSAIADCLRPMQKAGMVGAEIGVSGGFYLTADPDRITLSQIAGMAEGVSGFGEGIVDESYFEGDPQNLDTLRAAFASCSEDMDLSLRRISLSKLAGIEPNTPTWQTARSG